MLARPYFDARMPRDQESNKAGRDLTFVLVKRRVKLRGAPVCPFNSQSPLLQDSMLVPIECPPAGAPVRPAIDDIQRHQLIQGCSQPVLASIVGSVSANRRAALPPKVSLAMVLESGNKAADGFRPPPEDEPGREICLGPAHVAREPCEVRGLEGRKESQAPSARTE